MLAKKGGKKKFFYQNQKYLETCFTSQFNSVFGSNSWSFILSMSKHVAIRNGKLLTRVLYSKHDFIFFYGKKMLHNPHEIKSFLHS